MMKLPTLLTLTLIGFFLGCNKSENPSAFLHLPEDCLKNIMLFGKFYFTESCTPSCIKIHRIIYESKVIEHLNGMIRKCNSNLNYFGTLEPEKKKELLLILSSGKSIIKNSSYLFYKNRELRDKGVELPKEGDDFEMAKTLESFMRVFKSTVKKQMTFLRRRGRLIEKFIGGDEKTRALYLSKVTCKLSVDTRDPESSDSSFSDD